MWRCGSPLQLSSFGLCCDDATDRSVFRQEFQLCPGHTAEERYNPSKSGLKKEIPIKDCRVPGTLVACVSLLLLTLLTMLVNREWFYNPISFVDPAAYLGWSLHPLTYRHIFIGAPRSCPLLYRQFVTGPPSGELIPLILPNAVFYSFLPALAANFVIKFLCFFCANVCLFVSVREFFGVRAASISVIAFAFYRYTLIAFGSDYIDGRVALYFLLALACAVCASRPKLSRLRALLLLGLSGVFAQMMVSTCLLAAALLPVVFGAVLVVGPSVPMGTSKFKIMLRQVASAVLGFVAMFLIFSLIDKTVYGGDGFYLRNTFQKMFVFMGENRVHLTAWRRNGGWLLLPLVAVPVGLTSLLSVAWSNRPLLSLDDRRGMQLISLLVTAPLPYAVFIIFQLGFRQETLSNLFYFDFLTPLTFLLVGAMVYKPLSSLNSRDTVMAASGLLLLSVLILFHSHTHFIAPQQFAHTLQQFAHIGKPVYIIAAFLFVVLYLFFTTKTGRVGTIVGVILVLAVTNFISASPLFPGLFVSKDRRANFTTVVRWVQLCDVIDRRRQAVVWYDVSDPAGAAYMEMATASHMWIDYGVLNEQFPNATNEDINARLAASPTRTLLLLSQKTEAPAILFKRLEPLGLTPRLREQYPLVWGDHTFQVFMFTLSGPGMMMSSSLPSTASATGTYAPKH